MELLSPTFNTDWLSLTDEAAFQGCFTQPFTGGRQYTQLEALVLEPEEHQLLTEASSALAAIIQRVVEWVQRNPVLLPVLGTPSELEPWLVRNPGSGPFSLFARLDWAQDRAGRWWCLECNADTPGGLPEATVWQKLARRAYATEWIDPNAELLPRLGSALRAWLPGTAGFATAVCSIEDWTNTLAAARARGGTWVAGELPSDGISERWLLIHEAPIDSLYRFYPGDWLIRHPQLLTQMADGFPVANPGTAVIAQSKALFALLWYLVDEKQFLSPRECDWVRTFIPRTSLVPLPGPWIGKAYWEREGAGIITGEGTAPAQEQYAYQTRLNLRTVDLPLHTSTGVHHAAATPVVGVYLIQGVPSGYLTRMGGPITDTSASMVPTWIRPAP